MFMMTFLSIAWDHRPGTVIPVCHHHNTPLTLELLLRSPAWEQPASVPVSKADVPVEPCKYEHNSD